MILDRSAVDGWVWVLPSKSRLARGEKSDYLLHYGKWLIFTRRREYLEELAKKLDPYVEEGKIDSAKYCREPAPWAKKMVMCVYCDDRKRDEVRKILHELGVDTRNMRWKYERQTLQDWAPGGRLYRKAASSGLI
jgi:hypothetical protein